MDLSKEIVPSAATRAYVQFLHDVAAAEVPRDEQNHMQYLTMQSMCHMTFAGMQDSGCISATACMRRAWRAYWRR